MSSFARTTFGLCVAGCLVAPIGARVAKRQVERVPDTGAQVAATQASARVPEPVQTGLEIEADHNGHYQTDVRIDGFSVPVLVDTGATFLSLSAADARRIGVRLSDADYKYQTSTANGLVRVAITTLHEVQLGSIRLYDVKATVAMGEGLNKSLLGMSFLGRLSKVEVAGGRLLVRQ